jgi:hypothetical protein
LARAYPAPELMTRHLVVWGDYLFSCHLVARLVGHGGTQLSPPLASRFAVLSRHRWVPYTLVGFWRAVQHSFLPLELDLRFLLYKFLFFLPGVLALMGIYLRTRRVAPLIVAHSMMDICAARMTLSF